MSRTAGGAPPLSTARKLGWSLVVFVAFFLSLELSARVGSFLYSGGNPYYLFYGLRSWSDEEGAGHTEKHAGYFKFPAGETLVYGTPEPARINNHGFRGEDFEVQKSPGTFRVVCMGASSTFGYLNRDEETYPSRLGVLLERRVGDAGEGAVEVINAGIPHFNTENVAACLEGELLAYGPDLLTLYTGCNDAVRPLAISRVDRASRLLDEYSAGYATLRKALNSVFGEVLFSQWTPYMARVDSAQVERQLRQHEARTRHNLERTLALSKSADVPLVLIRQPITTWFDRENRGGIASGEERVGYEEEYERVASDLARQGWLPGFEVTLYVHHHLLEVIDQLAAEHDLPSVDNVALVSERPEGLGSKVHLTAAANERLANALVEVVARFLP